MNTLQSKSAHAVLIALVLATPYCCQAVGMASVRGVCTHAASLQSCHSCCNEELNGVPENDQPFQKPHHLPGNCPIDSGCQCLNAGAIFDKPTSPPSLVEQPVTRNVTPPLTTTFVDFRCQPFLIDGDKSHRHKGNVGREIRSLYASFLC